MKTVVVMGGSMAGLVAARALADHFDEVHVIERDPDPGATVAPRKGVPQGRHLHGFLRAGQDVLEGYFPGLGDEPEALGAHEVDHARETAWYHHGAWKMRRPLGLEMLMLSRPLLETTVLARVRQLSNYRAAPGVTFPWQMLAVYPKAPEHARAGVLFAIENGRYLCTLFGYGHGPAGTRKAGDMTAGRDARPRSTFSSGRRALARGR